MDINERVSAIKGDNEQISIFIEEYKPFIMGVVARKMGGFFEFGVDEEASVGLNAFYEAINSFSADRGSFLSFATTVIHRRLIDYLRKKRSNEISIEECNENNSVALNVSSIDRYNQHEYEEGLRIELDMFRKELSSFGISMEKLVKASPKQKGTKKLYNSVVTYIEQNSEISSQILEKAYLPVSAICEGMNINRKKIERGRDYIIACVIIKHGDYLYMREYVKWEVI